MRERQLEQIYRFHIRNPQQCLDQYSILHPKSSFPQCGEGCRRCHFFAVRQPNATQCSYRRLGHQLSKSGLCPFEPFLTPHISAYSAKAKLPSRLTSTQAVSKTNYTRWATSEIVAQQQAARNRSQRRPRRSPDEARPSCRTGCIAIPYCQKIRSAGKYAPVVADPRFLPKLLRSDHSIDREFFSERLAGSSLSRRQIKALCVFQMSGCHALATSGLASEGD